MKNIGIGLSVLGIVNSVCAFSLMSGVVKGTEEYKKNRNISLALVITGGLINMAAFAVWKSGK